MILKDGQEFKIPNTGPFSWEELKKALPDYFSKKSPIIIAFDPSLAKQGVIHGTRNSIESWPERRFVSRQATVLIDGQTCKIQILKDYTRDRHGEFISRDTAIQIRRGDDLNADNTDKELLWYLWFCANDISNNANPINSIGAKLSLINPLQETRNEFEQMALISKINAVILDAEKCPLENLHNIVRVLFSVNPDEHDEVVLRHMVAKEVSGNSEVALEVQELLENIGSEAVVLVSMVKALIDRKVVKRKGAQILWVNADGTEDKIITTSPKQKDEDRVAQFIATDEEWRKRFEEAYQETE